MPRDAWTAVMCQPSQEYVVLSDCRRFGLSPYLPEFRRRSAPPRSAPGAMRPLVRSFVLFKGYAFLPVEEARSRELSFVRGLRQPRHLLSDSEGRVWTAPAEVIHQVTKLEHEGVFEEKHLGPAEPYVGGHDG